MALLELGAPAPDFPVADSSFHAWLDGQWGLLFSYPKAFTSVCANELVALAQMLDDYDAAGVKVAAVSSDSGEDQAKFAEKIDAEQGCPATRITQLGDPGHEIAGQYGLIHPQVHAELTMRVSYVIDPAKSIRLAVAYPPPVSRDFKATLDAIRTMQGADARAA